MISVEWIRRLILVIFILTLKREYDLPLKRVVRNGHFSEEGLSDVVNILLRNRRMDIIPMIHETMEGNTARLDDFERNLLPYRTQFYNGRGHPPAHGWPQLLYSYSRNGYPVHQETVQSVQTVQETQGLSDGQSSRNERVGHRGPGPDRHPSVPQVENAGSQPGLRNPSRFPRPQGPLFGAGVTCCICGRNIQDTKNSPEIWSRITDIFTRKLTPEERQAFVNEVNKYDQGIFHSNQSQANTPRQIVDALERCNLRGEKCILCLLNYAFQRIGRGDLAREIRQF